MNKFVLIRYTPGTKAALARSAEKRFTAGLPFHVGACRTLDFPESNLLLISAEATTQLVPGTQYVHVKDDDFLVFDGVPFFKGQDLSKPWAQRLFDLFVEHGAHGFFERVMGDYCIVAKRGSRIFAFGDFSGLCPIFHAQHESLIAVSNRQRLLQSILTDSDRPTFAPEACAFITGQGNVFGEQSVYAGVKLISPNRWVRIEDGTILTGGFPRYYGQGQRELTVADGQTAAEAVFEQARCLGELPLPDFQMDLTGGMDSRAVLAVTMKAGLMDRVSSIRTYGPPGLPEFEVTSALADEFGLPHENVVNQAMGASNTETEPLWRRLRYNAMALDGTISADTGMPGVHSALTPCFSGTGGELFRPHIHARRDQSLATLDELLAMAENYQRKMDPFGIHRAEINASLRGQMRSIAQRYASNGVPFDDVHFLFYAEHRLPWWAGYALSNVMGRRRLFPLVSKAAAQIVYSGSPDLKKFDWLHFVIMKAADPRLLRIPFYDNKWDPRLRRFSGGLPMASEPFPVKSPMPTLTTGNWITEFAEADWDVLFDYILSRPGSQIFDFVDRSVLESRRAERKWASRLASASALLSLVMFRMVEENDVLPARQGGVLNRVVGQAAAS